MVTTKVANKVGICCCFDVVFIAMTIKRRAYGCVACMYVRDVIRWRRRKAARWEPGCLGRYETGLVKCSHTVRLIIGPQNPVWLKLVDTDEDGCVGVGD